MKFVSREQEIDATQWNTHGDHPDVKVITQQIYSGLADYIKEELADSLKDKPLDKYGIMHSGVFAQIIRPGDYIVNCPDGISRAVSKQKFEEKYVLKESLAA